MAYDPWDWTNQSSQPAALATPMSNTVAPLAASTEQAAPGQFVPAKPNQDLQQIRGMAVNKGAEKGANYIGKEYDAWKASQPAAPTYTMAPAPPLGSQAASTSMPMPAGLDMSGQTMAAQSTGLATTSSGVLAEGVAAPVATEIATPVIAGTAAPLAAPVVASAAPVVAAGAGEAGLLAGMGPVGWGIGAALLARSLFR